MKKFYLIGMVFLATILVGNSAHSEIWKDYDLSEQVTELTVVSVKSNYVDAYLVRLETTWVTAMEILKGQGVITGYGVWVANTADSPNVWLTVDYPDMGSMQGNEEQYDMLMKEMSERFEADQEQNNEVARGYEDYRDIVDYAILRRVTYK